MATSKDRPLVSFDWAAKNDLDKWIYFFKNSEIKESFKAKNIQLVKEKLDLLKMSESERKAYERYMMNKASEKDIIETAKLEGKVKGKLEIARVLAAEGMPVELISKITGLAEDEISKLRGA
jgi:predicted transposase/invertase (TIGR01784 family)